ncbi:uncharacterized protein LOC113157246 [Anabas testudineus]|uniref:uncharacterized protein LOC113157246 n=1 Tax=Anabas testudineus TaxID=64144 RepID=UPI000E465110|nr:uncharacterized protein LOC113157246 [Anabas testudineus]
MRSFALTTTLYMCSWISVSGSESQTVEVQHGEQATLLCSNISQHPTQTDWFRVVNRTKPRCISSMYGSDGEASYCDEFQNGFEMSSNTSTIFLKIKRVDLSDSGLYFCGFYIKAHTVITSATYLNVQGHNQSEKDVEIETEMKPDGTTNLMIVILGGLTVFLIIVIIVLVFRNGKTVIEPQPEKNKNLASDCMNPAAMRFLPNKIRSRRPAAEREVETCVVYAAS